MVNIDDLMRNCLKAMQEGEKDEAADFFTEDGVWVTPFGKFTGKEEIKEVRTVYDRFSTLEQAATGVGKFVINQIGKKFIVK